MITLTPPQRPLTPHTIAAPDGFAWWYVDLVDEHGNGLVFIMASGLPFLPGPKRLPSLNLAVYQNGAPIFYALQELDEHDARFPADGADADVAAGRSRLRVKRDAGVIRVEVDVDIEVEGVAHARGTIRLDGVPRQAAEGERGGADIVHDWSPQTGPCRGHALLNLDDAHVVVSGRGYYDRNGATKRLQALGIDRWWWCRAAHDDRGTFSERIAYVLWPEGGGAPRVMGLAIDASGATTWREDLTIQVHKRHTTLFGLEVFDHARLVDSRGAAFLDVRSRAVVDSGPFYVRGLLGSGVYEHVLPHRIDLPQHRLMVHQRVARTSSTNALMLPMFCGHAPSRVQRTLRYWWTRWRT